jgi:hypothetical protein
LNINIPPDSEVWLFGARDDDHACLWSFRYPPPCEVGDPLHFRFDGRLVARARVYSILKPGDHDTFSHHGKRFLQGHKVIWLQSDFEDLRHQPEIVAQIEAEIKATRRRRKP